MAIKRKAGEIDGAVGMEELQKTTGKAHIVLGVGNKKYVFAKVCKSLTLV
jgi:hypothetical protein